MKKLTKSLLSLGLVLAVAITAVAVNPTESEAAAKSYNCYLMYANDAWNCVNMNEKKANVSVKNTKGTAKYTVTLKRSDCVGDDETSKTTLKGKTKDTAVLCVDIKDILKDHKAKDIKITNVVVKCDGKKVKIDKSKLCQGQLEKTGDPNKYRLEIYNIYGDGTTDSQPPAKSTAFNWKKKISVSFKVKIKK